jgi:hypothetical protein
MQKVLSLIAKQLLALIGMMHLMPLLLECKYNKHEQIAMYKANFTNYVTKHPPMHHEVGLSFTLVTYLENPLTSNFPFLSIYLGKQVCSMYQR